MSKNKHHSYLEQVWEYSRILSVTIGLSVSAFTMAGYFIITTPEHSAKATEVNDQSLQGSSTEHLHASVNTVNNQSLEYSTYESKNDPDKNAVIINSPVNNNESEIPETGKSVESIERVFEVTEQDMFEDFKTECKNGIVNITWTTDGTDDESFKLEFSSDSIHYSLMNEIPDLAEVDKNKNLFKLTLPATDAETKYFRLRRDFPGDAFMYSQAVKVACVPNSEPEAAIDVFPAGNGSYRVVIDSKTNDHYRIMMTDMNEIELVVEEFDIQKGMNQFTFKSGNIPKGNYNFKVTNGTTLIQKKVAIK